MATPIWDTKNPKKSSKRMSTGEKGSATKAAKQHGRSSPSLVDNINAKQTSTSSKQTKKTNNTSKKSKKSKKTS